MLSTFDDEEKYNGKLPTGDYFSKSYKQYHATLRTHFDLEVKTRGAKTLACDALYKEARHLCQYKG